MQKKSTLSSNSIDRVYIRYFYYVGRNRRSDEDSIVKDGKIMEVVVESSPSSSLLVFGVCCLSRNEAVAAEQRPSSRRRIGEAGNSRRRKILEGFDRQGRVGWYRYVPRPLGTLYIQERFRTTDTATSSPPVSLCLGSS